MQKEVSLQGTRVGVTDEVAVGGLIVEVRGREMGRRNGEGRGET